METNNTIWVIERYDNWGEREVKVCRDRATALKIVQREIKMCEQFGGHLDYADDEDENGFNFIIRYNNPTVKNYVCTFAGYKTCFEDE